MSRILIRGGCVLTLGPKTSNHPQADVLIEDDRVIEVGQDVRVRDAQVVEASDCIVMPGFVDTHRHAARSLLRNLTRTAPSIDETDFDADDVYAGTMVALLGAIESGCTTVVDWASVSNDEACIEAALQAHAEAGLRTVFVHDAGPPTPGVGPGDADIVTRLTTAPNVTSAYGSVDVTNGHLARVEHDWKAARDRGLRVHAHAGLTPGDAGAVAGLAARGVLGHDVTLVHCTHLGDDDLDAVAARGAGVVVAPASEMSGSLGSPPLQKLLDRKIEPGLAVDDERLASSDMLAQMRIANSVQHAAYFDLKLAGKAGLPNLLTTRDLIRYATLVGAQAIGLDGITGSIEPGKQADIIVLRTDRPNVYPINDPIGAVVWGVDTSNVDWVFVGGRAVMQAGTIDADIGKVRELADAAQRRVLERAGLAAQTRGTA